MRRQTVIFEGLSVRAARKENSGHNGVLPGCEKCALYLAEGTEGDDNENKNNGRPKGIQEVTCTGYALKNGQLERPKLAVKGSKSNLKEVFSADGVNCKLVVARRDPRRPNRDDLLTVTFSGSNTSF